MWIGRLSRLMRKFGGNGCGHLSGCFPRSAYKTLAFYRIMTWTNFVRFIGKIVWSTVPQYRDVSFRWMEPTSVFSKALFSTWSGIHRSCLRYEICLCIHSDHIAWAELPDLRLAINAYIEFVNPGEKTFADKGYRDVIFPNRRLYKLIMAETVNRRLKQFGLLQQRFRHGHLHSICFHLIVNLNQHNCEHCSVLIQFI